MTIINNIEIDNIRYNENEIRKAIMSNDPIEDKLHVIIVISNPCSFAVRYILTKEFIRRMKDEKDIILYIVELVYGDQEYHITEQNNSCHLRLRTSYSPIWHKENMVNIGVKKLLPENWKCFAWIDADIEFDNEHWAMDTLKILNGCKDVVQLFSHNIFMDENGDTDIILSGLGFQHIKKTKRSTKIKDVNSYWHPGFGWACTRKFYEKMGGLYEYAITGDGDMIMASCFLSAYKTALSYESSDDYKQTVQDFENKVNGCRLGYVPGIIRHHYHGSINSRKYDMREQILTKYNYSPTIYLTKDENGLLIPGDQFPSELIECIVNHFQSKNEDGIINKRVSNSNTNTNNTNNNTNNNINSNELVNINTNTTICSDIIDLTKILEFQFKKPLSINCILINLKKDTNRLYSAKEELKKISINNGTFAHLDATYWKDTNKLSSDLNLVMKFLRDFNENICKDKIIINEFSEPNDDNIKIQGAPLACYCSHLKAMMHAYLNFTDYTIIVEDDISIDNTMIIEKYIKLIPDDWDIICLNSEIKGSRPHHPYYKFGTTFYHLHFYIIKNKCFDVIFKNIYPITDQIDILVGNMYDKLNIYNIVNTVTQKNFVTNIQNNLHVIYHTPVYSELTNDLKLLETICNSCVNEYLKDNDPKFNMNITCKLIEDIIYNNIFNNLDKRFGIEINKNKDLNQTHNQTIKSDNMLYNQIQKILSYFVKEVNTDTFTSHLIDEIYYILNSFNMHNTYDTEFNEVMKAYNFGATACVYLLKNNNIIVKAYNDKLRWTTENHNDIMTIYQREYDILKNTSKLLSHDDQKYIIKMGYMGETLYDNFVLPKKWKNQIVNIFKSLSDNRIYYPEFNLNNIVVNNNHELSFIDFGLCKIIENTEADNKNNCKIFCELLEALNEKYKNEPDLKQRHILYNTFMNNIRNNNKYPQNVF